jgi:outer membrane protein insertion porin family
VEGNDYTHEWVVRDKIFLLPGDVFSRQLLIQSYQSISSLGFFEAPLDPPDVQPIESGDVDIIFHVAEKQTGSVNFGTAVGGGTGLSGFIGYDQPNLFGQAKEGHIRWDFGRYQNHLSISLQDPALFQSRVSGSVSLFAGRDRFFSFQTGERLRSGINFRFGFPIPRSLRSRFFLGYGLSRTSYNLARGADDTSLFGLPPGTQSTVSLSVVRSTLNHPLFPTSGSRQTVGLDLTGGPILGGDGDFTKWTGEGTWWVPVGGVGEGLGGPSLRFALGLSLRAGALFGDASNFPFERYWMGGVQFGQMLRGYDETSITPEGYFPENSRGITDIERLGNAFLSLTAEYAARFGDNLSVSVFYDAGNTWRSPLEVDPARMFRGAGLGAQIVTPFGPLGLDYAYGFDKLVPGWQLHFRLGPGF